MIENQKNRLLERVKEVALRQGETEMVATIESAIRETQFTAAIDRVRHAIPAVLKIKEHNPLTLLHRLLSRGIHELSDDECLIIVQDIRTVLAGFADRLEFALRDDDEMESAVRRLLDADRRATSPQKDGGAVS